MHNRPMPPARSARSKTRKPAGRTRVPRPASNAALTRRAKRGDATALEELVERAGARVQKTANDAVKAIAAVGTAGAWAELAALMGESRSKGVTYVASRMLDRAVKKHPEAVEHLIRACENPAIDHDDVGLASLSSLVQTGACRADPRVLAIFRRALHATHPYAQDHAVMSLARMGDVASRPAITALLDQKQRGAELCYWIGDALVRLDGGAVELRALERARTRARPDEKLALDKAIAKLSRRIATSRSG